MAPDLNSLPPSSVPIPRNMSSSNGESTPHVLAESPTRSASMSLQAAATMNAGLQHETSRRSSSSSLNRARQSPHSGRRRSTVLMNLQLNDPSIPAPGEMVAEGQGQAIRTGSPLPLSGSPLMMAGGDPHHNRAPSLGELHQELEAEQEAQVNRLLQMIRQQQLQLQALQAAQGQGASGAEDSAIASERSTGQPSSQSGTPINAVPSLPTPGSYSRSPGVPHPRSSFDMARADLQRRSRTPSRGASPRLRSTSISAESGEQWVLGGRDESAFYQAETQMLVRENQMLRHRVRDLERQLTDMNASSGTQGNPNEPAVPSHLMQATSASDENPGPAHSTPAVLEGAPVTADTAKET